MPRRPTRIRLVGGWHPHRVRQQPRRQVRAVRDALGWQAIERLTLNDDNDERPSWSPDGTKLAFMREHAGVTDIYTIDVATRREQLLTPQPGSDSEPAWSPDGTRIAFNSARTGNFEIYVMQADGSHQVGVTGDPARDTYPAWSPDSRQIVFASNRSTVHFSDNDLFITAADGKSPARRLTHTPAWDGFPAWSRDGRWIAFVRSISEQHDIVMVDVATGIERPLTSESANENQPTWSPMAAASRTSPTRRGTPTSTSAPFASNSPLPTTAW